MELNDTFTIKDSNLDKKNVVYDSKLKGLTTYLNNKYVEYPNNNHFNIFLINTLTLGILTLDFYIIPVLKNNQIERRTNK